MPRSWKTWKRTTVLLAALVALPFAGCFEDDPEYDTSDFANNMAEVTCNYYFDCCDVAERSTLLGSEMEMGLCVATMRSAFEDYYRGVKPELWDGKTAVTCLDQINEGMGACPRSIDPYQEMDGCSLVTPTKNPGDMCSNSWDCSTKFCKSGVCANPLPEGATCAEGDRCATGLQCINGECQGLQPDGATCTIGTECISGACGGGVCVVSAKYTCDGK